MAGAAQIFFISTSARAQNATAPSPLERSADAVPTGSTGEKYDGVVPGPAGKNPLPAAPANNGPYLVWTGFQMTPTGSRVFLQTTQAVTYILDPGRPNKSGKSVMAVLLPGCRIHMANNRRKIDTRFFATPVANLSARQRKRDVEVRIALREAAKPDSRVEPGPDGTQFVILDFPPGKAAPEPSALEDLANQAGGAGNAAAPDSDPAGEPRKKARKSSR